MEGVLKLYKEEDILGGRGDEGGSSIAGATVVGVVGCERCSWAACPLEGEVFAFRRSRFSMDIILL